MTLVTTDQQLARFAVEMAAGRTGWPSEVIPLEDGWLVRNAHVELGEAEVRQAFTQQQVTELREGREREERSRQYREAETGWRPLV